VISLTITAEGLGVVHVVILGETTVRAFVVVGIVVVIIVVIIVRRLLWLLIVALVVFLRYVFLLLDFRLDVFLLVVFRLLVSLAFLVLRLLVLRLLLRLLRQVVRAQVHSVRYEVLERYAIAVLLSKLNTDFLNRRLLLIKVARVLRVAAWVWQHAALLCQAAYKAILRLNRLALVPRIQNVLHGRLDELSSAFFVEEGVTDGYKRLAEEVVALRCLLFRPGEVQGVVANTTVVVTGVRAGLENDLGSSHHEHRLIGAIVELFPVAVKEDVGDSFFKAFIK
jgi:hypothetical protein